MGTFRFPLKRVLELRKESERRLAVGLARARNDANAAKAAKEDLEAAREAGRSGLAAAHGAGNRVGHLQNLASLVQHLEQSIEHADARCREAEEQVVESLQSFRAAHRDRRSLEELEARKRDEWKAQQGRTEQMALDETARVRHARPDVRHIRSTAQGGGE